MAGYHEVRADGRDRRHDRLFCVLERDGARLALGGPRLVVLTGIEKPFRATRPPPEGACVIIGGMAAYVKAAMLAFAAAVTLGAGIGAWSIVGAGELNPADKATVYASALADAMNCAAFLVIVFVPLAVVVVWARRFRRGRAGAAQ